MLSTHYLFEITDLNKQRLGVAGRAALVGGAGLGLYRSLKGDNDDDSDSDNTPPTVNTTKSLPSDLKQQKMTVSDRTKLSPTNSYTNQS